MKNTSKITISFDPVKSTAHLEATGDLTTGEYAMAASMSLKGALKVAEACGCPGCTASLVWMRASLLALDHAQLKGGAALVGATVAGPVMGSC